jgi:RNA polymerase sigma factor (sigma-70 family)
MRGVRSGDGAEGSAESRRSAAAGLIDSHDAVFRRTARRYSICGDDAEDAYQRSLEILLTKAPPIGGDNLVRWMQTVTKREALSVRRQRERMLSAPRPPADEPDRDPLDSIPSDRPQPEERAETRERVARSREALRSLKPQEVRVLTLKAEGYSYAEIGAITGWSYTKINRCMAEGRKRFLATFAELEHGDHCESLGPTLSALADGEADVARAEDVQVHLRSCGTCRARLRAFREVPGQVAGLAPLAPVAEVSSGGRLSAWVSERVELAIDKGRELSYSAMARSAGTGDGPAVPIAGSGGTRGAGMAAVGKLLAVCGATAAGGAACVAGGVVSPGAVGLPAEDPKPALEQAARPAETPIDQAELAPPPAAAEPAPEPVAQAPAELDPKPAETPAPGPVPEQQFSFEPAAAAPASGGSSEFGGSASGAGSGGGGGGSGGFGFEK